MTSLKSGVRIEKMIKCIVHRIKNIFSYSEEVGRQDFLITNIALVVALVAIFEIEMFIFGFLINTGIISENIFKSIYLSNWYSSISGTLSLILVILIVIALWANLCRRLNDLWISRWASLILFVPILNILFELYVLFVPGKKK